MAVGSGAERDETVMGIIFDIMDEAGVPLAGRDAVLARADGMDPQQVDDSAEILAGNGRIRLSRYLGGGWTANWMSEHEVAERYGAKGFEIQTEQRRLLTAAAEDGNYRAPDGVPTLLVRTLIQYCSARDYIQGHAGPTGRTFTGRALAKGRRWLDEPPNPGTLGALS